MFRRRIEKYLLFWKGNKKRKPLIMRGARQVGKTSVVLSFGKRNFKSVLHINLENKEQREIFGKAKTVDEFVVAVEIYFKEKVEVGKTLLFIDEIQESLNVVDLLRFFYEEKPELHVIATGSLFEVKVQKGGGSMPVGRVEFVFLHPVDFFEYLEATGEKRILEILKGLRLGEKISDGVETMVWKRFWEYAMFGGMPEVVKNISEGGGIEDCRRVLRSIITAYVDDVYKYASLTEGKYLSYIIENGVGFAGSIFKYENFGGSGFRSREMSNAFGVLEKVMLLKQLRATSSVEFPVVFKEKRSKKLLWLDVGWVNFAVGIYGQYVKRTDLTDIYRGRIAEQIVGQSIVAGGTEDLTKLWYWAKEKSKGSAELDFCFRRGSKLVGVEVKSGKTGKLKSLFSFGREVKNSVLVKVSMEGLGVEEVLYDGRKFQVLKVPFYLTTRLSEFVEEM